MPLAKVETISLGKPIGKAPHGRRSDGRAAPATKGQDAVDAAFAGQAWEQDGRGRRHGGHALAAVAAGNQGSQIDTRGKGHDLARDVRGDARWAAGPHVYKQRLMAESPDLLGHLPQFLGLGVQGAQDCDNRHV